MAFNYLTLTLSGSESNVWILLGRLRHFGSVPSAVADQGQIGQCQQDRQRWGQGQTGDHGTVEGHASEVGRGQEEGQVWY